MEQPVTFKIEADLAGVVRRARQQKFPLHAALLELVDNSIDAGAKTVTISEQSGDLIVSDDGCGFGDIPSSLVVGRSSKENAIGRYGVGLKDACIRYSNATIIRSRGVECRAPWEEITAGNSDGTIVEAAVEDDGLTTLILEEFRERYTKSIDASPLQRVYSPLLDSGALKIELNGSDLSALRLPKFSETIEEAFDFRGKRVRLFGGIFKPDDEMRRSWSGYNPYYLGRLIGDGRITSKGTGDEPCSNFSFLVHLEDGEEPWVLATNKDDVDELDELLDYCYSQYTRPLLKKAAQAAQDIELKEVEEFVNSKLGGGGNITRRKTEGGSGKTQPKNTGPKKVNTYTADTEGVYANQTPKRKGRPKIQFRFSHFGCSTLAECHDQGRGVLIEANLDNGFIDRNKHNEDTIFAIAKLVYSTRKELSDDLAADEIMNRIMDRAGNEME